MLNKNSVFEKAALFITAAFLFTSLGCQTLDRGAPNGASGNFFEYLATHSTPEKSQLAQYCAKEVQAACGLIGAPTGLNRPLSILQGWTSSHETRMSIVAPRGQILNYLVLSNTGERVELKNQSFSASKTISRDDSHWSVDQLDIRGLNVDQVYELWVVDANGQVWDRRQFRALNELMSEPKLIVVSCMDDGFWREQNRAWQKINERSPDLMIFLGDNVYGDKYLGEVDQGAAPKELWRRYVEMRNTLGLYRWPKLVPVIATWDDHDYGFNGSGSTYIYKNESREIFWTFFPQKEVMEPWQSGPGVSSTVRLFGQEFLLTDDRSFRTPDRQDNPDQTHLGKEQEAWIDRRLQDGRSPIWIMNGDQFFGAYHRFESFEAGHPIAFDRFRGALRRSHRPVVLISGDRHIAELMRISKRDVGFETYELTSSGVHAKTYANSLQMNPNPRRLNGASGPMNFLEIEPRVKGSTLQAKIRVFGVFEGLLYERNLTVRRTSP